MSDESNIKVTVVQYADRANLIMFYVDPFTGQRKTKSARTSSRKEAERAAAKWEHDLRNNRYQPLSRSTWEDFRERYEAEVMPSGSKATARKVMYLLDYIERTVKLQRLRDLDAGKISHVQTTWRNRGLSEQTIKSYLNHLASALSWAVRMKMIPTAPQIERPKRAKASKVMKGRPITGEEFERMLDAVPKVIKEAKPGNPRRRLLSEDEAREKTERLERVVESWKHFLRGLWLSGLRLSEALELHWDRDDRLCVDLSGKRPMLRIPAAMEKGNQDRLLPMAPEFAEFVLAIPEAERSGRVFNPRAQRVKGSRLQTQHVSKLICDIGEKAGIKVNTDARTGKVKYASAHDLRRSFGERWAMKVMPQVLKELMRHESIETTMRYYVGRNAQATADVLWEVHDQRRDQNSTPAGTASTATANTAEAPSGHACQTESRMPR